jgi:glycerol-3-phosphate acyltransferase PlsY
MLSISLTIIAGYLLGSIPFGWIVTKLAGHGDIRAIGSGNIGATNVLRTGSKKLAFLTLFLDCVKGFAAAHIASMLDPTLAILGGTAAVFGHIFPVWLKFKGGKGVATMVGALIGISWPVGLIVIGIWVLIAAASRISSLASLVALAIAPLAIWDFKDGDSALFVAAMALLVIFRHKNNIERLLAGTEPKIGQTIPKPDGTPAAE